MKVINTCIIEKSGENGYEFYRIPGITSLDNGTILVSYEARHGSDWSVIDLYIQRSEDSGKTWESRQLVFSGKGKNTTNNPVFIAEANKVHLLCFENYKRLFHLTSIDNGKTWSEPEEITYALEAKRIDYAWTCAAVGPGHGMQLSSGRLIASIWLSSAKESITLHWPSKISTIFSDDHGKTWSLGEIFEPEGSINPNETCLAELDDGSVMLNIRTMKPLGSSYLTPHHRYIANSMDGVSNWKSHEEYQLPDPVCAAGMCNIPGGLAFSNCADYISRCNHSISVSYDNGVTWKNMINYNNYAGYSDCIYNVKSKTLFAAYEYNHESEIRVCEIDLSDE